MTLLSLERQIAQAGFDLQAAQAEEDLLLRHVALLRPQSLDRDMLDEQVRLVLNLAHPDDLVILWVSSDVAAY
jgi:cell division protein FtsB